MATAAVIGGGLILSNIAGSKAKEKEAEAIQEASAASQAQAAPFLSAAEQAQQVQLGLLGQGTPEQQQAALQSVQASPLVQALNAANEETLQRRGIAAGAGTGGILNALQQANQANLLQGAFGGLQQVAGTGVSALPGSQQAIMQGGMAAGQAAAAPFQGFANTLNQGTQLAAFGAAGGFGTPLVGGAAAPVTPALPTPPAQPFTPSPIMI
jgi:hypothetical protein